MDYLQALEAVCRLDLGAGHLPVRVVGFPLDQVAGCPPALVVASLLDRVAVFLQGRAVVFQLGLEVECALDRHLNRIAATYPLGRYLLSIWKKEVCSLTPTSSNPTCDESDRPGR